MASEALKHANAFRKALQPFGLDRFMLSNVPARTLTMKDGRVLVEFQTMKLPIWYPQKLNELAAAGFDVVTFTKRYKTHPPQLMYYVRWVQEIKGGSYGNQ